MLYVTLPRGRPGTPVTRRSFLQVGTLGAIGLSLPQYLAARRQAPGDRVADERACILILNVGAPSQLDTFDMKPDAPAEIRGPFRPIRTACPDIQLSELLPRHAQLADKLALVRSCHHDGAAVHDVGWQLAQTGRMFTGGTQWPHVGAVVSHAAGSRGGLPPFAILPGPLGRGGGNLPSGQCAGFLGPAHNPQVGPTERAVASTAAFDVARRRIPENSGVCREGQRPPPPPNSHEFGYFPSQCATSKTAAAPPLTPSLGEIRLTAGLRLPDAAEQTLRGFEADPRACLQDPQVHAAFAQVSSAAARRAYNLQAEPPAVRARYGPGRFGQSCLLARRLIEAGVRLVTINTFMSVYDEITWDIHGVSPFSRMEDLAQSVAPLYDQAYGALIEDLDQRGLLPRTLVCNLAEFGRTPRINAAGGRDHWTSCYTCYFAGGGVQGGRVVGRSDALGGEPADRPVEPPELVATMLHSLGLSPQLQVPGPDGQPGPLLPPGTQPIRELF